MACSVKRSTAAKNFNISVSGSLFAEGERADRVGLKFESWQNEPAISPPGGNVRIARMVSAVHGTLLECDIPTKVFILHLNDEQLPSERFVIQDLDDTHLLVQPDKVDMVRGEVAKFLQRSQYTAAQ